MNAESGPRTGRSTTEQDRGDALVLVDIENLIGGSEHAGRVATAWEALHERLGFRRGDKIVVASGPRLAQTAVWELPLEQLTYRIRPGVDGADEALIEEFDRWAQDRYQVLVICSGDGRFAGPADDAREHGIEVWQVTGRGGSSARLSDSCARHESLEVAG